MSVRLDQLVDPASLAGLLALGSSVIDGEAVALVDVDGHVIGGRLPTSAGARRHPIEIDGEVVGSIVAGEAASEALAGLVARSVELVAAGARRHASRVRLEHELAIGRRIQLGLLPQRFPPAPGWSFAAAYEPAREVGGDMYDAFAVGGAGDRVAILVADVTGKGIPAALLMADVRALLHAAVDNAEGCADALARVNRILVRERPMSLFVTVALLVVDVATGVVRHSTAGHEPIVLVRSSGERELLEAEGPLLGAFDDATFDQRSTVLGPGDFLVAWTDGITEARDPAGRFFGEERFFELVTLPGAAPAAVTQAVRTALDEFRAGTAPFDDLTLVVARRD